MKPAHEPASSRPKPCASMKKPHESCPFAAPYDPCRKKNDRGQRSAFPSEISRFALSILAHRGSALPWLVNDRAVFHQNNQEKNDDVLLSVRTMNEKVNPLRFHVVQYIFQGFTWTAKISTGRDGGKLDG